LRSRWSQYQPAARLDRREQNGAMRVFDTNTLLGFGKQHADAANAVRELNKTPRSARWSKMQDIVDTYPSATVLNADREVIKIKGNDCRAIVALNFRKQGAFIKFMGTHAEYDSIDALTVDLYASG
jgi:mRNA interferase HigB